MKLRVLAQKVHAPQELIPLVARDEVPALVSQILRHVHERRRRRSLAPGEGETSELTHLVSRHIAHDPGERLFQIRAQQHPQLAKCCGDVRIAADFDPVPLQHCLRSLAAKCQQSEWTADDLGVRRRLGGCRDAAARTGRRPCAGGHRPDMQHVSGRLHQHPGHFRDLYGQLLPGQLRTQCLCARRARQAPVQGIFERTGQHQ